MSERVPPPAGNGLPLVVIGGGGHARVVADAAAAAGLRVAGYVAPERGEIEFAPYLGGDEAFMARHEPGSVLLAIGVGATQPTTRRQALFEAFRSRGYGFASVVHPAAWVSPSVRLGDGCQVMAGCVVQCGTTLGDNTIVNTRASIDHDCRIGAHTHVAPGATLCGGVTVGQRCHIGAGAILIQNVSIADDQLVRAGERVTGRSHGEKQGA